MRSIRIWSMQMTTTNVNHDATLVAHLLRRAAFGSTPAEFDRAVEQGFDKTLHLSLIHI